MNGNGVIQMGHPYVSDGKNRDLYKRKLHNIIMITIVLKEYLQNYFIFIQILILWKDLELPHKCDLKVTL